MFKQGENIPREHKVSYLPFTIATILLVCAAIMVTAIFDHIAWQKVASVTALLITAMVMLVLPVILQIRIDASRLIADSSREINRLIHEADNVLHTYAKLAMMVQTIGNTLEETRQGLAQLYKTIVDDIAMLKQKEAQLQEARRERERAARDIELWEETAIEFMDYLQRLQNVLPAGDGRQEVITKILHDFSKYAGRNGFELIRPERGSPFIPEIHEAISEEVADVEDVADGFVLRCESWGYRCNGKVRSRARVVLASNSTAQPVGKSQEDEQRQPQQHEN